MHLKIGEISARTGVSVATLRFYESKGLIHAERNVSGHRVFLRSSIRRVSFILIAQQFGFSLRRIQAALSTLPDHRTPTKNDWAKLSAEFSADIDRRIADLERMKSALTGCMRCGCLSLEHCALYNADDRAAASGPGPHLE